MDPRRSNDPAREKPGTKAFRGELRAGVSRYALKPALREGFNRQTALYAATLAADREALVVVQ